MSDPVYDETGAVIDPIMRAFEAALLAELEGELIDIYLKGSAQMKAYAVTQLGRPIYFEGPPMDSAIAYARDRCAKLVTRMNDETRQQIADLVADAIQNKRGVGGLATDIKRELGWMGRGKPSAIKGLTQQARAEMIARTETANALEQSFLDRSKAYGVTGKEWVVSNPCEICALNAGVVVPIDAVFPSGHDRPPVHPRCLLPDVRVEAPRVIAGSRALYRGKAVEVCTENGHRLAVTPNHMILTPSGFVAAQSLREGDYVVCCHDGQRMLGGVDPHDDHRPSPVSEIWDALVLQRSMMRGRMPVAALDFHGDGRSCDGDVDIVWSDCLLLRHAGNAAPDKHLAEQHLGGRDAKLSRLSRDGSFLAFADSLVAPTGGGMGMLRKGTALLERERGHAYGHGGACAARSYSSIEQPLAEDAAADAALAGEFLFRFASFVAPEQVRQVRDFDYSGHVYDLQTVEQWYIGNSIIQHNCVCSLAPVMLPEAQ